MHVTRLADALPYEAPKHHDMIGLRLQGWEASPTETFWVGLSQFLPGGGADSDATPLEKVYVVLEGTVTVITEMGETELHRLDSCYLAPDEQRCIENRTNETAYMLVAMNYPRQER
jgi:quercetin dioxygenase-like cupin family protein